MFQVQTEILRLIFNASNELGIQTFVIGAIVRDLIFLFIYKVKIRRATEDLDFGVAVSSWDEYEKLRNHLFETEHFKDDKKIDQRIWIWLR